MSIHIFQQNNQVQNIPIPEYLPTPQISIVGCKDKALWKEIDNYTWRSRSISDVVSTIYTSDYYITELDIYLNSFGVDRKFLELPDLKLELCRVSSKKQGGWSSGNINNIPGQGNSSKKSQKDYGVTQIVHSASIPNGGNIGDTVSDTKYSGGNGTFDITEWNFPNTNINDSKLNRHSNPSLRVEIDLKKYFKSTNGNYGDTTIFPLHSGKGHWFYVRGTHNKSQPRSQNNKIYYLRNAIFFFRLSAGVPNTQDANTGVYQQRLYSDLSQPIYFKPQVRRFFNGAGDINSGEESCIYHYKIGLGNRP